MNSSLKGGKIIKINSIQKWFAFEEILDRGIIKINKNKYIKILKVTPINFNLKSQLEKDAILNSYKIFLKTCNFDIQILIQSKKEDLSKNILNIKENIKKEKNKFIQEYSEKYINFIQKINNQKNSASKNIYIIIKKINSKKEIKNPEEIIIQELNENYFIERYERSF